MQQRTYECVEKVASILQSQLDLAKNETKKEKTKMKKENLGKWWLTKGMIRRT